MGCESATPESFSTYKTQSNLRWVEPARVFGCVVERKSRHERPSFFLRQDAEQGGGLVDVQIVNDKMNFLGMRVGFGQTAELPCERFLGSVLRYDRKIASGLGLADAEDIGLPQSDILVVAKHGAPLSSNGDPLFTSQENGLLVEDNDRLGWIIWASEQPKNGEHPLDELVVEIRNDPHFFPATA